MSSLLYFFLKRANANGKHYSIITDHLGTPIEAYNQEGALIWEREQDLYGNSCQGFAKENFRCPFKYQGQYYDPEIELCYNRFKYYHPETGRYISEDPIGFLSGEANFFTYVSDTNAWVDLLGLSENSYNRKEEDIEWITVGRWMSEEEYNLMKKSDILIGESGGLTFVTTGGHDSYTGADKGSIYVEFEVPKNSLIQGGKENWYKIVSPTASRSQKYQVEKQGGEIPPKYRKLSPPILTK